MESKKKSSITVDNNIILEPDVAFKLGKSIRRTEAKELKKAQEKDKIGSKLDKNGKRGEAKKCQKQIQ
nr:hypothetical protein [Tanacetum cinerariifolium]